MSNRYVLGRFSHGNEPIFLIMNPAAKLMEYDPDLDLVIPAPHRIGLVREIIEGQNIDKRRVYIDPEAHDTSLKYEVHWGGVKDSKGTFIRGPKDYTEWVMNNKKRGEKVYEDLRKHYQRFRAVNLEGEEKEFTISEAQVILNAGDLYDDFGNAPIVYSFPHRHSELLRRTGVPDFVEFSETLRGREKHRAVNFIPQVHSLAYDENYDPLKNEEFTPHMKETPRKYKIEIPSESIVMIFSGTGRNIETLKSMAAHTAHPIVTGVFSPVEVDSYIKIVPPRAEFVHVFGARNDDGTPKVIAGIGQTGYGFNWSAWNSGIPIIFPTLEEGGDEEFRHNRETILKLGLGIEISKPEDIDSFVERSKNYRANVASVNADLMRRFGTLDGISYIARRITELGLI